jgi:hypothetical protein
MQAGPQAKKAAAPSGRSRRWFPVADSKRLDAVVDALIATFSAHAAACREEKRLAGPGSAGVVLAAAPDQPTVVDLKWAKRLESITFDALPNTRAAAVKWASTITAVTGVFGIFALVKGRSDITALTHGWELIVAGLFLVAVLCLLRSIVLAALAAEGTPTFDAVDTTNIRGKYSHATTVAAFQLVGSRVLAVLAMLLVTAAVGIVWFGPNSAAPALSYVSTSDGTLMCGALSVGVDGKLNLKQNGVTATKALDPAKVRAVVATATCPG